MEIIPPLAEKKFEKTELLISGARDQNIAFIVGFGGLVPPIKCLTVLHKTIARNMLVERAGFGTTTHLFNMRATEIYLENFRVRYPELDHSHRAKIGGTAILITDGPLL